MKITLHHVPNVDLPRGYWQSPIDKPVKTVECATLRECAAALDAWITKNGLGGGNMASDCGLVSHGGKIIAEISYNGRVWLPGSVGKREFPSDQLSAREPVSPSDSEGFNPKPKGPASGEGSR